MTINFYSMDGCGYCDLSKQLLKKEINTGEVKLVSHKEAPAGVMGFPYFTKESGNRIQKSFAGYPGTKENLYHNLGMKGGNVIKKPKLNKWQAFLKKNGGKGWTISKMKKEYKKKK